MGHFRDRRAFGNVGTRRFRGARYGDGKSPRFTGLLDLYGGASAAYSLRALSRGWLAGDVVEVRRSSDSATADFTASQITSGALVTWVGAGNDGFVSTWYDQSGNANDATQATTTSQPKIVDAGALVTGGLDFDGVDDRLNTSLVPPSVATLIGVSNWDIENATTMIIGARDSADKRSYISQTSGGKIAVGVANGALDSIDVVASTDYLSFGMYSGADRLISVNSSPTSDAIGVTPANATYGYSIGALNTAGVDSAFMDGTIAEIIIYASDQSANRVGIETNINDYYSIY